MNDVDDDYDNVFSCKHEYLFNKDTKKKIHNKSIHTVGWGKEENICYKWK